MSERWYVEDGPFGGWYCTIKESADAEDLNNWRSDRVWPKGIKPEDYVDLGTAITMCDVFNARDFGAIP